MIFIVQELKRLGVGGANSDWMISRVNEKYVLCDTYPSVLGVPTTTSSDELMEVARFRSKGRLPVLSWLHPETLASITRCSQPLVGLAGRTCTPDERLIQQIMEANAQSHK